MYIYNFYSCGVYNGEGSGIINTTLFMFIYVCISIRIYVYIYT
jgi:hypothetical protein